MLGHLVEVPLSEPDLPAIPESVPDPRAREFFRQLWIAADASVALLSYVDKHERYAFINKSYERWFGLHRSEVVGRTVREVLGEDTYASIRQQIRRALSGERVYFEQVLPYQYGGPRHVEAQYIPHVLADGTVAGYAAHIADVTAARRAEARLQLLEAVSRTLAEARLELPAIFNAIAQSIVGRMGDGCVILSLEEGTGDLLPIASHHADPATARDFREHLRGVRFRRGESLAGRVAETGKPLLIPYLDLTALRGMAHPAGYGFLERNPAHSLLMVSLQARGVGLGAVIVGRHTPGPPLTEEDQRVLQEVADRAALSLQNARLYEAELTARKQTEALATELQSGVERERQARAETERALALVDSLVASAPAGFSLLDTGLRYLKLNPALAAINGLPLEVHLGRTVSEVMPKAAHMLEPPLRQVLETGQPLINLEGAVETPAKPGVLSHYLASFFPVKGPDGKVSGVGGISIEVTEQVRARRHMALLAEAGQRLLVPLNEAETIEQVARLVVESLADSCLVDLMNGSGELEQAFVIHRDPAEGQKLQELRCRYGLSTTVDLRLEVLRTGKPLVFQGPSDEMLRKTASDAEHLRLLRELSSQAICIVPLRAHGRALGVLSVNSTQPGRTFQPDEVALLEDLAARAALAIDHARLYADLQKAVRVRDEFLSVASHELKTPLTPLSLKLQMLERDLKHHPDSTLKQQVASYVELGHRQIKKLTELIGDLLDVSRIGAGRLRLEKQEVELGAVVREVVTRFEPTAAQAGSPLEVQVEGSLRGKWDVSRLEQVVTNLLDNALKYGAGKPILVRVRAEAGHAVLTVTDHGIGIEPSHLSRIFERFERAVSERHYGGLGLGLYITRELVQAHGGSIRVESEPNVCTVFTVELPLS
jgi:PAS domain S-box-containing protein